MKIKELSIVPLSLVLAIMALMFVVANANATHVSCGDTLTSNTTLDSDLTCAGNALVMGADNITLDCNNHTVAGNGSGTGINLAGWTGVTVRDCNVTGFSIGISLFNPAGGGNNTIIDNALLTNNRGIRLASSSGNFIEENDVFGNFLGIRVLFSSNNNTIVKNTVSGTTSNAVNLQNSTGNTVSKNQVTNNGRGISLFQSSSNTVEKNTVSNNAVNGFRLILSNSNTFTKNESDENGGDGFQLEESDDNTFVKNESDENGGDGFDADSMSSGNILMKNTAELNGGVGYGDSSSGEGTAGTANTYNNNKCDDNTLGGSSPAGLCSS